MNNKSKSTRRIRGTVHLGDKVTCKITGFKGTVTGLGNFMNRQPEAYVTPRGKHNELKDSRWISLADLRKARK